MRPKITKNNGNDADTIKLGDAIKFVRNKFRLSQRDAANELGISFVHLNRVETGKASPSQEVLNKFREVWGVDVYLVAVCFFADPTKLPEKMRGPILKLKDAWKSEFENVINSRMEVGQGAKPR